MASSNGEPKDAGFATPAATLVALALGVIASAVTASSVMELRLARADLDRARADYALAGAQQEILLSILSARQEARLAWRQGAAAGEISVLAEPESQKVSLATGGLDDATLAKLGVQDNAALRGRLATLATAGAPSLDIDRADDAPLWRACARSIVSPYGERKAIVPIKAAQPKSGPLSWRIGEVWRLRVASGDGWMDDRIVRFTGDLRHPAAVMERRLRRTSGREGACESLFVAGPKA